MKMLWYPNLSKEASQCHPSCLASFEAEVQWLGRWAPRQDNFAADQSSIAAVCSDGVPPASISLDQGSKPLLVLGPGTDFQGPVSVVDS